MNESLTEQFNSLTNEKDYTALPYMFNSKDAEKTNFLHNHDRYLHTFNLLKEIISNKNGKLKILDIGTSLFTFLLKKNFPHIEIWTIDFNNYLKDKCEKFGIKFIRLDLSSSKKTLPKNSFDVITYLEVIEHLKYGYKNSLKKMVDGLKKDGVCIVQTPNKNSLRNILLKKLSLESLWKKNTIDFDIPAHFRHHREFSKKELRCMLESISNAEIISVSYGLYFDTLNSALAHRKNTFVIKELLALYCLFVKFVPFLRADIEAIFSKKGGLFTKRNSV